MTTLLVIVGYLCLLLGLGFFSRGYSEAPARITSLQSQHWSVSLAYERVWNHHDRFCAGRVHWKILRTRHRNLRAYGINKRFGPCGHFLPYRHSLVGIRQKAWLSNSNPIFQSPIRVRLDWISFVSHSRSLGCSLSSDWDHRRR